MVPKEKRAERTLPFFQVVLTRGTKSNATKIGWVAIEYSTHWFHAREGLTSNWYKTCASHTKGYNPFYRHSVSPFLLQPRPESERTTYLQRPTIETIEAYGTVIEDTFVCTSLLVPRREWLVQQHWEAEISLGAMFLSYQYQVRNDKIRLFITPPSRQRYTDTSPNYFLIKARDDKYLLHDSPAVITI